MKITSKPAITLINVQRGRPAPNDSVNAYFRSRLWKVLWLSGLAGSIYPSMLVHQNSLSNLAVEYASMKTTGEIIRALVNEN